MILSCVAHRSISFCILPIPPGYKTFNSDSAEDLAEEFELNKIDSFFSLDLFPKMQHICSQIHFMECGKYSMSRYFLLSYKA